MDNEPYDNTFQPKLIIKERPQIILSIFLISASLIAFFSSFNDTNFILWLFLTAFLSFGIKLLVDAKKQKHLLVFDHQGIYYYEWPKCIEWKDIVAVYFKEADEGEYSSTALLISFYIREEDSFVEKEINLAGLDTNEKEISRFTESFLCKADNHTIPAFDR